ncbi:cupin domain-containing protein [Pacificoceanicola onchidii]|uniref:cupin domain-containing protein n=1 Tax=Pacificoceanicola onchidii TaxID=2562685 RepID=UPI0010A60378|nr:cupin domain-containing protein [Pacificoceanicola onchidii]
MLDQPNAELYADWPEDRRQEIVANWNNRNVGSRIVSETDTLRIWHLSLEPGQRAPFHRHQETYFWTILGEGKSRSHYHDGAVRDADYKAGDTKHFELNDGDFFVHDLENIGDTTLSFVTVEFKA